MLYKEMRASLKAEGVKPIPLKNTEMYELYIKVNPDYDGGEPELPTVTELPVSDGWTYIGAGDEPPHMICFMGKQNFVRGQLTQVADKEVLAKLENNHCFIKGEYNMDDAFKADKAAAKVVQLKREEDVKTQIHMERANRKG